MNLLQKALHLLLVKQKEKHSLLKRRYGSLKSFVQKCNLREEESDNNSALESIEKQLNSYDS